MFSRIGKAGLWGIVFLFILLSFLTPLSFITISFIMVPIVVAYVNSNLKTFIFLFLILWVLLYVFGGKLGLLLIGLSLFYFPAAMLMGHLYRKQSKAKVVITAGMAALFAELLLILVGFSLAGVNIPLLLSQFAQDSVYNTPLMQQLVPLELQEQYLLIMRQMIPLFMILFSAYYAVITHWISRKLLDRPERRIPKLEPIKDWMVPKSLVWYYLIALFLDFVMNRDAQSTLEMILINLVPLLMFVFAIQGISFLFFIADLKKWNKALPVVGIVLLPFFAQVISLLGIFDVAFQVRKRIRKS